MTYDAYGKPAQTIAEFPSGASAYPYLYTGQRYDPTLQAYDYKARIYSATDGRFWQTDPIGTKDDGNLYGYTHNSPLQFSDPTGNIPYQLYGSQDAAGIQSSIDEALLSKATRWEWGSGVYRTLGGQYFYVPLYTSYNSNIVDQRASATFDDWLFHWNLFGSKRVGFSHSHDSVRYPTGFDDEDIDVGKAANVSMYLSHGGQVDSYTPGQGSVSNGMIKDAMASYSLSNIHDNGNGSVSGTVSTTGTNITHRVTCDSNGICQ